MDFPNRSGSMVPVSQPAPRSLIHHADFRRLWIGDTASQLGVALGGLAVPYLAGTALGASEFQMGLLSTLTSLGFLIIGLPSGALIDRRRKRTVMMVADVGRALLLATLPLAWWLSVNLHWQAQGAFLSIVIAECSMAAAGMVLFRRGRWARQEI